MKFIKFMQKRPSDKTIRVGRIIFWFILIISLYYHLIMQWWKLEDNFFWINVSEYHTIIKYIMVSIWIIPLIMWVINVCILKKKYMRILQWFFWILLFYISSKIIEWPNLWVDTLVFLMWFLPLFAWITWKCITSNCMKYKEKITKIRV